MKAREGQPLGVDLGVPLAAEEPRGEVRGLLTALLLRELRRELDGDFLCAMMNVKEHRDDLTSQALITHASLTSTHGEYSQPSLA